MAARPGEDNVATLFGDIHYFYGPPTENPPHHRFDKGSYVYLFEDANAARARIEIANQPGTDEQDAFDGYLDSTQLRYSYKRTCVVTLEVGEVEDDEEWHLPTYDPHNQNKYHYKLHSLDIYFWTQPDALQFVNGIRRVLPPEQCEILDEPAPPPRTSADVSAVVQKLEKAAISEPHQQRGRSNGTTSFAPPPLSAVSGSESPPRAFAPIAYNPAAPAAPESIRPREKTPPPEDGGLNPLQQTLAHDATTPFSPGLAPSGLGPLSPGVPPPQYHSIPGAPVFAAPPQHSVTSPGLPPPGFGAGHTHPGLSRAATVPIAAMQSPGLTNQYSAAFPGSPGFAPPPNKAVAAPVQHTPTPPTVGAGPPPGGYSQYSYSSREGAPLGAEQYSVHQQLYKPTEAEMSHGHSHGAYKPKAEVRGRLEENAGRLERGVTGMLRKFEKKFG